MNLCHVGNEYPCSLSIGKRAMQVPNSCCRLLHQMDQVSSIEHPQSNGQAKAFNKVILDELKNNLDKKKKHGSKLLGVLWAYRCIPQ